MIFVSFWEYISEEHGKRFLNLYDMPYIINKVTSILRKHVRERKRAIGHVNLLFSSEWAPCLKMVTGLSNQTLTIYTGQRFDMLRTPTR